MIQRRHFADFPPLLPPLGGAPNVAVAAFIPESAAAAIAAVPTTEAAAAATAKFVPPSPLLSQISFSALPSGVQELPRA